MKTITIDMRMIQYSGIGIYLKNLIPRIIEQCPETRFILLGNNRELDSYNWSKAGNIDILHCEIPVFSAMEPFLLLRKIPSNTDIYWCPHFNIPIGYKGTMLTTIHDILHISLPKMAGQWYKTIYAQALIWYLTHKSAKIITVSNFTKQELIKHLGTTGSKIIPIHCGVDESWFHNPTEERKQAEPYLVYVGNVKRHKNLLNLVKAFETLTELIPHKLIIIGKKEGFITGDSEVEKYASKLGTRIEFTGFIEDAELRCYVANAAAIVFPSFYEGFGLPLLEAMACGCPVIASKAASIPEVCGEVALYFDPWDIQDIASKIKYFVDNEEVQKQLLEGGRMRAKTFTWKKCADQTIDILQNLLNERIHI